MRAVRKRQILKIMKPRAINMLVELQTNEIALACHGQSIISERVEDSLYRTLSAYAAIIERNNLLDVKDPHTKNPFNFWKHEVMNHLY